MAIQSHNFFEKNRINVHYDYTVESVDKLDSIWKLTYVLYNKESEDFSKVIHFVTKDNLQSFQIDKKNDFNAGDLSTPRKNNSGDRNLWWSEWMVVLCGSNEFGNSSDFVFRWICEWPLVYETLISDSTD